MDYLRDPAALLVMMVSLSLVASTLGLLLASVLKSEQALIATTVLVSMAVAALSGAWFPLEITGPTFQTVGHLLPTAWILDGLRGIVVRGFDVADVLPAFAVSVAWSAGFFVARRLALPPQRLTGVAGYRAGRRGAPDADASVLLRLDARVLGQRQAGLDLDRLDDARRHRAGRVDEVLGGELEGHGPLAAVADLLVRVDLGERLGELLDVAARRSRTRRVPCGPRWSS